MRRQILTAKSGISNHAAAGIRDDPCLSKFGTLRECPNVAKTRNGMPATAWKQYVNFASKICRRLFILELFCSLVF